tara:strand:- start:73 stop:753 length:681 start_codon:yes stop_codon:yes gene_type:complete
MESVKPKKSIEKMTVVELRKELKRRKLRITGSKAVQLQRLRDDDKLQIQKKKEEVERKERSKIRVFDVNNQVIARVLPSEFYARKQELIDKGGHTFRRADDRETNYLVHPKSSSDFEWTEDEDSEEREARELKEYDEWFEYENKRIEKVLLAEEEEKRKNRMGGSLYKPDIESDEAFNKRMREEAVYQTIQNPFERKFKKFADRKARAVKLSLAYEADEDTDDEDY